MKGKPISLKKVLNETNNENKMTNEEIKNNNSETETPSKAYSNSPPKSLGRNHLFHVRKLEFTNFPPAEVPKVKEAINFLPAESLNEELGNFPGIEMEVQNSSLDSSLHLSLSESDDDVAIDHPGRLDDMIFTQDLDLDEEANTTVNSEESDDFTKMAPMMKSNFFKDMKFSEMIANFMIDDVDSVLAPSFLFLDIVWAKKESGTWWPAIICEDPDQGHCYRHGPKMVEMYVQFFGDDTGAWMVCY